MTSCREVSRPLSIAARISGIVASTTSNGAASAEGDWQPAREAASATMVNETRGAGFMGSSDVRGCPGL